MRIDKNYMLPIIYKLVEDIKAKEMDYAINGVKVKIAFNLTEAQILLDALYCYCSDEPQESEG